MKLIKYFLSFILFCSVVGCEVDPVLTESYPEDIVYKNEENFNRRIYGFYELLNGYGSGIGVDALADLIKVNEKFNSYNYIALGLTRLTPSQNGLENWSNRYANIRYCNEFLYDTEKYGHMLPDSTVARGVAEIRFFRGMLYFDLLRLHPDGVIVLDKLTSESLPISEPDICWDFVAKDLDYAAENLPKAWPNASRGRITKGGAYGLKAKAMLYAGRWQEAADAAKEVMKLADEGLYKLAENYKDAFKQRGAVAAANFNPESVIEFAYKAPDMVTSGFDESYALPSDPTPSRGLANPTQECVDAFQMADGSDFDWSNPQHAANPYANREPRFYASILYNGAEWKKDLKDDPIVHTYEGAIDGFTTSGNKGTVTGYYIRKLLDETLSDYSQKGEQTYYYMRYAEVLLIHAEAMAELGNIPAALESLNKVRARAFNNESSAMATASNKTEFMRLLRHERIVELAFEGHRYWDLRRWGLAKDVLNNVSFHGCKITKNADESFTYKVVDCDEGFLRYYDPRYDCFPIPQDELSKNLNCQQYDEWR